MTNADFLRPNWPAPKTIHAAMTLRTGGVSQPPFASLNPATHVGDNPDAVQANRLIIKEKLRLPSDPIWLEQVHSNRVVCADQPITAPADASFTAQAGVVCAVLTADCLPLLFCSRDGEKIAAVHAGWRGLQAGIIGNTVAALQTTDLFVWLAPAIGAACFEVGDDVREAFYDKNQQFTSAFMPKANGKWLADIYQLARLELNCLGITHLYSDGFCTVSDAARFYSYRRNGQTGRMATLIWKDATL
jgi:YfiH family protein